MFRGNGSSKVSPSDLMDQQTDIARDTCVSKKMAGSTLIALTTKQFQSFTQ